MALARSLVRLHLGRLSCGARPSPSVVWVRQAARPCPARYFSSTEQSRPEATDADVDHAQRFQDQLYKLTSSYNDVRDAIFNILDIADENPALLRQDDIQEARDLLDKFSCAFTAAKEHPSSTDESLLPMRQKLEVLQAELDNLVDDIPKPSP
mmetsp:Transcript_23079/g.57788  ORF Transcript_23079/g.57788 Transcript_23079/m.57788 type:complete len:153 (-) Transcript_23079:113-571(-)